MPQEHVAGNVAIIPVEPTLHSPNSQLRRELTVSGAGYSGRIAFSLDNIALDQETTDLVEDTLGLFGILLLLSTASKSVSGVDVISDLKSALLSYLSDRPERQLEKLIADLE